MFKVDTDRLDYSELLMPPEGFAASYAVGTTYSLDLETLVGIPLSLSLAQSMDGQVKKSDLHILEAIRKASDKMTVFCQSDKIAVPVEKRLVFSLLENSVHQVNPKHDNSFHPKVWFVKYTTVKKPESVLYRLIVLSRNLTFDRSWDIAACLDGKPVKSVQKKNQPLTDFVQYLSGFVPNLERRKKIRSLAKELLHVRFELKSKDFTDVEFLPLGIPGHTILTSSLFEEHCDKLAVISPFLTPKTVDALSQLPRNAPMLFVSRKAELCKLSKPQIDRLECWHLKESVVEGEDLLEGEEEEAAKQDIHAKFYLKTNKAACELWLGSANCSYSAFHTNIEFMLKLNGSSRSLSVEFLKKELFGEDEKANPFQRFDSTQVVDVSPTDEEMNERILEKFIREICATDKNAVIEPSNLHEGRYRVTVRFGSSPTLPQNTQAFLRPLMCASKAIPMASEITFEPLEITDLSLFYAIRIELGETVKQATIKVATDNMPEARDGEIFRSMIKDKDGFLQYIAFLLGEDYLLAAMEQDADSNGKWKKFLAFGYTQPVLYEKMLKTVSRYPERLQDIKNVMDMLERYDDELVPPEFRQMYEVFHRAAKKSRRLTK